MRKYLLLFVLVSMLLSSGCAKSPSRDLPPTMLWHKDQNLISPAGGTMNVWEGLRIDQDAFTAERNTCQFILWRGREERVPVFIEYSLLGGKVNLTVNLKNKKWLSPSSVFKKDKFSFRLSQGMNFLQFAKRSKDKLRIRSITIGTSSRESLPHLRPGESFSLFHLPGSGRLELRGRGQVEITEHRVGGDGVQEKAMRLKSGWLSGKISHAIDFSAPGLLTVSALKGNFNISSYSYAANPAPGEEAPKSVFQGKPNIYIILSDACQAFHVGTYGYRRSTTPHVDAFARDAVVYEYAYANSVFTRPSIATLFTGLYPDNHKVRLQFASLPPQLLILPEYFKAKGYGTSIFSSNVVTSPRCGFTQGVDVYFSIVEKVGTKKDFSILDRFRNWLAKTPPSHFSFMHYIHPHFPKVPPEDFPVSFRPDGKKVTLGRMNQLVRKKKQTGIPLNAEELQELTDGYDSSIAWVDSEFGKTLSLLKEKKLYDDSMIIFLADHGEAQGEHGVLGHGRNVFEETTRVPLIIKYPKRMELKGRVRRLVELADFFPTIAALFGQKLTQDGRNLPTADFNREMDDRFVVSRTGTQPPTYGLRWKNWYYMIDLRNNNEKLFLPETDPIREIGSSHPAIKAFLKARFLDWYGRFRNGSDTPANISLKNLPASEIEEMKTLGYL